MNQSPQGELAVRVENVSRHFRGVAALDQVSLQIPIGSIFGLVGLNGAGKTTLIRHLIGSYKPQQGAVMVLGSNPCRDPEGVLKSVGYLTEEDSLPKWMRVGDLIDFTRAVYPSWDDQYSAQLCEMFSLSRGSKLRSLSKGQRARAGLLVAIAHRPQLLLLDEPSSGLDPIARSDILEAIIRTISEDGRTVLFSSHLLDEVDRVCDAVALMHEGKIIESLTTEQLEARYAEVICRPREPWQSPPKIPGAIGWNRIDQEWSAMVEVATYNSSQWQDAGVVVQHREITLDRWFAARVGVKADTTQSETAAEVASHV